MDTMCSVKNCPYNAEIRTTCFFSYPLNLDLCLKWIKYTENREYLDLFAYGGALSFFSKFICHNHFSDDQFLTAGDPTSGLKPNAIPTAPHCQSAVNNSKDSTIETVICLDNNAVSEIPDSVEDPLAVDQDELCYKSSNTGATNAIRMAQKRNKETAKQRAARRHRDKIRARQRRENETEMQRLVRRYKDAVRVSFRRSQETESERAQRLERDKLKMRLKRMNESPEQRAERLRKDRERARRYRTGPGDDSAENNTVGSESDDMTTVYPDFLTSRDAQRSEVETKNIIRRYRRALNAQIRRSRETEEQREERKRKDRIRIAEKRRLRKMLENGTLTENMLQFEAVKTEFEEVKHELINEYNDTKGSLK